MATRCGEVRVPVYAYNDDGRQLGAKYEVVQEGDGLALILASASGTRGDRQGTTAQYRDTLLVLLQRLKELNAVLDNALVDSEKTRRENVLEDQRRIIDPPVQLSTADVAEVRRELLYRQSHVARSPDAKRGDGNATRQIRLRLTVPGFGSEDAKRLADVLAQRFFHPMVLGEDMGELPVGPLPPSMLRFPPNAEERSARVEFDGAEDGTSDAAISDEDSRKRVLRAIFARQGQSSFRDKLLRAYGAQCVVTGCDVKPVLEAAHLRPYLGLHTNGVTNGLLLRADIHTLLDYKYLAPDPGTRAIVISKRLDGTQYSELSGRKIAEPVTPAQRPTDSVLERVWQEFRRAEEDR